jgi:hypothetical protein
VVDELSRRVGELAPTALNKLDEFSTRANSPDNDDSSLLDPAA